MDELIELIKKAEDKYNIPRCYFAMCSDGSGAIVPNGCGLEKHIFIFDKIEELREYLNS